MSAEINALSEMCKDAVYFRQLGDYVGVRQRMPSKVHEDNTAAVALTRNPGSSKSKHVETRMAFIRELVDDMVIGVVTVKSADQKADILSKPLAYPVFNYQRELLGIRDLR
jgi:hypothetical protein